METKEIIKTNLDKIFKFIGIDPKTEIEEKEENNYSVTISGDNLNFLIGFRGQSLEALQNILRLMIFRKTQVQPILTVDINDYRDNKSEKLQDMAKSFIDKVRFFQKEVELPRMSPWERREIHMLVSEYEDIFSESTGEGEDRRIVLKLKKQNSKEEKE
ncbi:hypothetical protein K0B04_00205 [Patescibacteria group bacterium]|nr:hypothetical protein [Patescibacteria group bacterium]